MRTTILAIVDPRAEELAPLTAPSLTAWGLIAWTGGALLAALCVWTIRLGELFARHLTVPVADVLWLAIGGLGCSALGACVLIRPHARAPVAHRLLAALGVALYAPLIWAFWAVHVSLDSVHAEPYMAVGSSPHATQRTALRLAFAALAAMIAFSLRPSARGLAARSFVFRTGQIDRQSLVGLVAALAVAAGGDAVAIAAGPGGGAGDVLRTVETALVALGSFLITVGLFAAFVDTVRLRRVLTTAGVGLSGLLETNQRRDRRAGGLGP